MPLLSRSDPLSIYLILMTFDLSLISSSSQFSPTFNIHLHGHVFLSSSHVGYSFTVRRYASAVCCRRVSRSLSLSLSLCVRVCVSVCLFITFRVAYTKTTKSRIMCITLHNIPTILVFFAAKDLGDMGLL